MAPLKPLDGLDRLLSVLRNLNAYPGLTVSDVARLSDMPRAAANRYLVTLESLGYAERDLQTRQYKVTSKALELSSGAAVDDWVTLVVYPALLRCGREVGWPCSLNGIRHARLAVIRNTDADSPMIVYPMRENIMVPLIGRSGGHVILAYKPDEVRQDLLTYAVQQDPLLLARARLSQDKLDLLWEQVRTNGYALTKIPSVNWSTLSVPLQINDVVDFSISVRFHPTAVTKEEAVSRFVDPLRACAEVLAEQLYSVDTQW